MVIAYNKKGQKQIFSDQAWKLLGKDKGVWQEKATQLIQNSTPNVPAPDMGPPIKKNNQVIENDLEPKKIITEEEQQENEIVDLEKKKSEFMKAVDGISKGLIKDYFDQQKPAVVYSNKSGEPKLQAQLGEYLGYDIVKLQTAFK